MTLYLDVPNSGAAPFQTIVFWPGTGALFLESVDVAQHQLEFLLKDGRAVAYPVYAGTFQRRLEEAPSWSTVAGRDLAIREIKDLRRTIDYLETRPDIDRERIGYYGASWGGRLGAHVLAVEPRVKAAVLDSAGFNFDVREEIRAVHYLPRVTQPVLQFNGRFDSDFRYETHAKPYFELLGTSANDKKWIVEDTGHFVTRPTVIGETLDWFDKYLGRPVR
jgi:dipeptidyl aminopeptidase/acylaminoacyl peptidase